MSERSTFVFRIEEYQYKVSRELFESALFRLHTLSCSYNSVNIVTNGTTRKNCRRSRGRTMIQTRLRCSQGGKRNEVGSYLFEVFGNFGRDMKKKRSFIAFRSV